MLSFRLSFGDFSCQVGIHAVADFRFAQSVAEEEHQFGDGAFGGAVVAADDTCLKKLQAGFVPFHFNGTSLALGDVDDDDTSFVRLFQLADEPLLLRCVAGTEGFEYHCFQTVDVKDGVDDALLNAGKESEYHMGSKREL